jgi:hypothetical protein
MKTTYPPKRISKDAFVTHKVVAELQKANEIKKLSRNEVNEIVHRVCEENDFIQNEFSIIYSLGLA